MPLLRSPSAVAGLPDASSEALPWHSSPWQALANCHLPPRTPPAAFHALARRGPHGRGGGCRGSARFQQGLKQMDIGDDACLMLGCQLVLQVLRLRCPRSHVTRRRAQALDRARPPRRRELWQVGGCKNNNNNNNNNNNKVVLSNYKSFLIVLCRSRIF